MTEIWEITDRVLERHGIPAKECSHDKATWPSSFDCAYKFCQDCNRMISQGGGEMNGSKKTEKVVCANCGLPRGKHTKSNRLSVYFCKTGSTMWKPIVKVVEG